MESLCKEQASTGVATLPEHIWKEVFEWGVAMQGGAKPRVLTNQFAESCRHIGVKAAVDTHPWPFPWNISYTSPRWRELAIDTASLWSDIYVIIPTHRGVPHSRSSFVPRDLQLMVDRSKKAPIRLHTCGLDRQPSDSVWALINASKHRYVSWKLSWRPEEDLRRLVFTKRLLSQWCSLTSLEVEFEASHSAAASPLVDFSVLPSLRSYKERGSWICQTKVKLPLGSLESITLHLPLGFISAQLGPAPNLRRLVVEVGQPSEWLTFNTLGISNAYYYKRLTYWPRLKDVTIRNASFLLRFCEGSPLRSLCVDDYPQTGSMQSLGPVCRGSVHSLRELTLNGGLAWTDQVARQGITTLMSIEHLRITYCTSSYDIWSLIDNEVGERFWATGLLLLLQELLVTSTRIPCPGLRTLEVEFHMEGDVSVSTREWLRESSQGFIHLIGEAVGLVWESRLVENNKPCATLQSCSFSVFAGSEPETWSDVKLLTIQS